MRRALAVLVALVALAGCGSSGDGKAAPETTTTTTVGPGCPGESTVPQRAPHQTIDDVDGDGQPDTAYLDGSPGTDITFGIVTAAGGGSSVQFDSASPVERRALTVNADGRGAVEVFLSDGRSVQLLAFVDCRLRAVRDEKGEPYVFDRGFRDTGTGVGCIDADGDGKRDLVGLKAEGSEGDDVGWSRTIVELDGTIARNGQKDSGTYRKPDDDARIDLLYQVTCGDKTLTDGLTVMDG
ncbi:MAG: uncharacterized protein JWO68_2861 [Actinomycetia bacterium]|nr:uncharacterized protein [Actinomycetes bacterium]